VREINEWFRTNVDREPHLDAEALAESIAAKRASLGAFLEALDVDAYLAGAGVSPAQLAALRARLMGA